MKYAMWSPGAQSWITYNGRVLVHDNSGELEFLFPGATVRPISGVAEADTLSIKDHPGMATVRWPLRRKDFW